MPLTTMLGLDNSNKSLTTLEVMNKRIELGLKWRLFPQGSYHDKVDPSLAIRFASLLIYPPTGLAAQFLSSQERTTVDSAGHMACLCMTVIGPGGGPHGVKASTGEVDIWI
jgi:hypothetical protein